MPLKDYRDELIANFTKTLDEVISLSERLGACEADIKVPMHVHLTDSSMSIHFEPIWEAKSKNHPVGIRVYDMCVAAASSKSTG